MPGFYETFGLVALESTHREGISIRLSPSVMLPAVLPGLCSRPPSHLARETSNGSFVSFLTHPSANSILGYFIPASRFSDAFIELSLALASCPCYCLFGLIDGLSLYTAFLSLDSPLADIITLNKHASLLLVRTKKRYPSNRHLLDTI